MSIRLMSSLVLVLMTLGWGERSGAEQMPAPRGELHIVDKRWSNRFSIENHVIEPLLELGPEGTLVPRLSSGWRWRDDRTLEVTLRHGVTFHNGEVLDAYGALAITLAASGSSDGTPGHGAVQGAQAALRLHLFLREGLHMFEPHDFSVDTLPR